MSSSRESRVALAVGAHPDDVEISSAGTLKALQDAGYAIHVATMTLGDCGSKEIAPDRLQPMRRAEAEEACRILGATYHYVGAHDFTIFNDDLHNRRVTALVREVRPAIVFTHSPGDYMLDHDQTSVLVRNACFQAPAPNYDCSGYGASPAIDAVPHLYYWDVMEGTDIFGKPVAPAFYVDISGEIALKSEMLGAHRSQREWLRAQHGIDEFLETMRAWSARRGREAAEIAGGGRSRIAYAEVFRQHLGHAYPHDNILAALLPSRVVPDPEY